MLDAAQASAAPAAPATPLTLEQKIENAAAQAAQVASSFSPAIGMAIQAGVEVEPVISGMVQLIIGLFRHHVAQPAA